MTSGEKEFETISLAVQHIASMLEQGLDPEAEWLGMVDNLADALRQLENHTQVSFGLKDQIGQLMNQVKEVSEPSSTGIAYSLYSHWP